VAIDYSGDATTFNGTGWAAGTVPSGAGATEVACVTASSCFAAGVGFGGWDGSSWSPISGPARHSELALSCPTEQLCVVQNSDGAAGGQALVWDGSQWSMSIDTPSSYSGAAVSCPTADFCMQVNGYTSAYQLSS